MKILRDDLVRAIMKVTYLFLMGISFIGSIHAMHTVIIGNHRAYGRDIDESVQTLLQVNQLFKQYSECSMQLSLEKQAAMVSLWDAHMKSLKVLEKNLQNQGVFLFDETTQQDNWICKTNLKRYGEEFKAYMLKAVQVKSQVQE